MRFLFLYLFLFNFCEGQEESTDFSIPITYAGMTIECARGCGVYGDPDLHKIWSILETTTKKLFQTRTVVDAQGEATWPDSLIRCNNSGDYERWDWKVTNGVWPFDKSLNCYQEIHLNGYPDFLEIARGLREDARFYYFTIPRRFREFETDLIAKLKEGIAQGYNIYRIPSIEEVEFSYQQGNSLYTSLYGDWRWIDFQLDYLTYYGWRKIAITEYDQKYKEAEEQIEQAIVSMDALFRDIFVYCLERHQPEGIAFSSAIESLLAGNLAEGIKRIRQLIEIGESQQFPSELMGKLHLLKGQLELESSLYAEAILTLTEAIAKTPALKETYLERGTAYFELGEYECSMEDYLAYTACIQSAEPFSLQTFSLSFAKNILPGCYESGRGLYLLLSGLAQHPIHTAHLIWESLTLLSKLAATKEWKLLAEAVAPEVHQLLVEWDSLPSEKRGELAGYAFGKYGADLLMPVALAKAASKGLKYGAQVSSAYKNLRAADQALLLESLSSLKSAAKIEEAVVAARQTAFLGEELGLTARNMGQLKQTGTLQETIAGNYESLSASMQESLALHKRARELLKPYLKKTMPESRVRELIQEMGIPTFPRPNGIPDNYLIMISDKGAGMKYVDPLDPGSYIRVMPGKPHSSFSYQQKPYVNQRINGKSVDKHGNIVLNDSPEAHILIEEFIYKRVP